LNLKLITFHQKCIREILEEFKDHPFVVSDVVKCFVVNKNENNFRKAMECCVDNFLSKQFETVKPKITVLFGNWSIEGLMRLVEVDHKSRIKELGKDVNRHGKTLHSLKMAMGFETTLLFSRFPTQRQADNWIRYGGSEKIIKEIHAQI